ncbi:MAG: type II secretion system F family protein [Planctomycetota bacterium]
MPEFSYKARLNTGALTSGTIAAGTAEQAAAMLRADGKFVVNISSKAAHEAAGAISLGGVKRKDVVTFCHQLGVMLDTGVPISEALDISAEQAGTPAFRTVIEDVAERVRSGGDLSSSLSAHPRVFPNLMISLVRAGEASGKLGAMLDRVSEHLQKQAANARKIKGALTYPAIMFAFVVLVTVFLLVFVLPRFANIFADRGAALPTPTLMLMAMSNSLIGWWWAWVAGLVVVGGALWGMRQVESGRALFDAVMLRLPVIGSLMRQVNLVRMTQTIGTLLEAGVPILDMVDIVRHVTPNRAYQQLWEKVDDQLRKGSQLSDGLRDTWLVPRAVVQMIYSGEKSGRMGPVINRVAAYTEDEFDTAVKNATQYIEPVMVVTVGGIVGFVAISLLLPIFSASSLAGGG